MKAPLTKICTLALLALSHSAIAQDSPKLPAQTSASKTLEFPGVKSDFRGYDRYDKVETASGHFSVISPKLAAPGKPWLWRSLFWDGLKAVNTADLKLVEQGYHIVLAFGDVSGHPRGNANIDAAYDLVTTKYGFSKKCSMASMSRGTLSLFRWATSNPEKVESIYVDNGVCNILSWPAGSQVPGNKSTGSGNPGSWKLFKKSFGYATDAEALLTKESPIDLLEPLAKAGVPILMVCGSKDPAVPYEENDAIMEARYKKLGGSIKVIIEDKGHSHGMKDPTPVLEFIKKNTAGSTEVKKNLNPYALTANHTTLAPPATLKLDPNGITMLAPNLGKLSKGIRPIVRNYMILWSQAKPGSNQIEWTVEAPADGIYSVTASVEGKGSRLVATSNGEKLEATISEASWHRIELGNFSLKAGENKILLEIEAITAKGDKLNKPLLLSALELVKPAVREAIHKEALAMRKQPDWFKDAGYGLMFQWTNRATPPEGPIKPWEEKINDFDLDRFITLVEDSGASYVIWSATWGNQYISAPIQSLDAVISGRTTKRDLLGEMAERLHEKGVRLIFYYHYGYECYHSQDTDWLKAAGGYEPDKTKLFTNVMGILSEMGARYGDKLDGWWFDGGARYLNCHFDGSSAADGILTAPFKKFTAAARKGNPDRMVAYNSWIKPLITDYQDYYGGEGKKSFNPADLTDGVFNSGLQQGLQAHGCFILEGRWGHIDLNTPIPKPKFNVKQLTNFVTKAQQNRYPLSINLEMYEDGSVSPQSATLLRELKAAVRKK